MHHPPVQLVADACASFPHLQVLHITNACLRGSDASCLFTSLSSSASSAPHTSSPLRELALKGCLVRRRGAEALADYLASTTSLKQLDVNRWGRGLVVDWRWWIVAVQVGSANGEGRK